MISFLFGRRTHTHTPEHALTNPSICTHTHTHSAPYQCTPEDLMAFRSRPSYYGLRQGTFTVGGLKGLNLPPASFRKIHRSPRQGNEMDDFFSLFFFFYASMGTLHSNTLSLYFTFPWYLAPTRRPGPPFPFGKKKAGVWR